MSKDQKIIIALYIAFIIGFISNFIPSSVIQMAGGLVFLIAIPVAYFIRSKNEEPSYNYTHTKFLIKTFWIASLILIVGIVAAIFWGDHTKINAVVDGMGQGISFTQDELNSVLRSYAFDNIITFSLCLGPSMIYLAYRVIKGLITAVNNQTINNLKNWL